MYNIIKKESTGRPDIWLLVHIVINKDFIGCGCLQDYNKEYKWEKRIV